MADRINVSGAASTLSVLNSDFNKSNKDITSMLDDLKYLQENFHDMNNNICTDNYNKIAQGVYDASGLIEMIKRVHQWCDKVDSFVEEEERRIEEDRRREEEERRRIEEEQRRAEEESQSKEGIK